MRIITWGTLGVFLAIFTVLALSPANTDFGALRTAIAQETKDGSNPFGGVESKNPSSSQKLSPSAKTTPRAASPKKASALPQTGHSYATRKVPEVQSALSRSCNLEYVEVPFADVRRELEDKYGFNIVLDQTVVDDSLTGEELVTVRLRGIKLSNALRLMLREFNATYVINNGTIRIISLDNVEDPEMLSQRMINVRSLLKVINPNHTRLNSKQQDSEQDSLASAESLLRETITNFVQRDLWKKVATIDIIGGVLVMSGPEGLLDDVSDFLQDLEAELKSQ